MTPPVSRNRWQFWGLLSCVFLLSVGSSFSTSSEAWEMGALNAAAAALLLLGLAVFDVENRAPWTDFCQIAIGLWMSLSPHFLGYEPIEMARRHFAIGLVLVVLGVFSLLQESICRLFQSNRRQ
jgi:hypothetical protein